MKPKRDSPAPPGATPELTVARSLLIGLAFSALLLWACLRAAQASYPRIPLNATLLALPVTALAALMLAALSSRAIRRRLVDWLERYSGWLRLDPIDALLISSAPLLSLGASVAAGNGRVTFQPALTVVLWIGALACALKPAFRPQAPGGMARWPRWEFAVVGAISVGALFLRAYQLGSIPWLLTGDEGSAGLSAVEFLEGVWNNPFNIAWFSFPSLYFLLPASSIYLLGQTVTAVRLPSAIAGALTVLALYGYARRAFGRRVAVLGSLFLAGFHFHIHFSRIGLNNVWDGLFFVMVGALLWRAWVRGSSAAFVWPGVALGFSLYFYATARLLPVLVLGWLLVALAIDRAAVRQRAPGLLVLGLSALAVVLPLALYFAQFPNEFMAPMTRVGRFSTWFQEEMSRTGMNLPGVIVNQFRLSILAFFSVDLRHWYIPDTPMLLPLSSTFFALGCLLLIIRSRDLRYAFLALWLLSAVVTGAISESTPASQRYLYAAPAVALVLALPLAEGANLLQRAVPGSQVFSYGVIGALLASVILRSLTFYFWDYSSTRKFGDLNTETANAVGHYLQAWPPGSRAYFLGGRMGYYSHSTIPYLAPQVQGQDLPGPIEPSQGFPLTGPTVFLVLPEWQSELGSFMTAFPQGDLQTHRGKEGETLFFSYAVQP